MTTNLGSLTENFKRVANRQAEGSGLKHATPTRGELIGVFLRPQPQPDYPNNIMGNS